MPDIDLLHRATAICFNNSVKEVERAKLFVGYLDIGEAHLLVKISININLKTLHTVKDIQNPIGAFWIRISQDGVGLPLVQAEHAFFYALLIDPILKRYLPCKENSTAEEIQRIINLLCDPEVLGFLNNAKFNCCV